MRVAEGIDALLEEEICRDSYRVGCIASEAATKLPGWTSGPMCRR